MSNFNANSNSPHSRCTTPLLHQMPTLQLTSLIQYFNITQHIWAQQNQSSQLDDIWTTSNILTNCSGINISPSTGSTDTRKKYLYYKITEETWKEFSFHITNWMINLKLTTDSPINDVASLNKHWHKWNMAVKEAANNLKIIQQSQKTYLISTLPKLTQPIEHNPTTNQTVNGLSNPQHYTTRSIDTVIQSHLHHYIRATQSYIQ
ncbi:43152_t:CDS:2, partial [Gigaspora margarita]